MLQLARIIYSHTNSNINGKSIHVARGIRTCGRRICFVYGDVSSDNDLNQLMFIIRNNYQIRVGVRFFSQSKFLHFSLTPFVQDKELISLSLSLSLLGTGCGAVSRAVASDTRNSRFKSSHWQTLYYLLTVYCIEKTKRKRGREWPISFLKRTQISKIYEIRTR